MTDNLCVERWETMPQLSTMAWHGKDGKLCAVCIETEAAEHLAACLEAARWRPIDEPSDYTGNILLTNGVCFEVVFSKDGEFAFSLPAATHWRPIGPLPEVPK